MPAPSSSSAWMRYTTSPFFFFSFFPFFQPEHRTHPPEKKMGKERS